MVPDAPAWLRVRPAGADDEVDCERAIVRQQIQHGIFAVSMAMRLPRLLFQVPEIRIEAVQRRHARIGKGVVAVVRGEVEEPGGVELFRDVAVVRDAHWSCSFARAHYTPLSG